MSYANIGMRPDYMSGLSRPRSVYSPLTSVSGMQRPQVYDPSLLQEAASVVGPLASINSATKQLTGLDPAKELSSQIKELFKSDPSLAQSVIGSPYDAAYTQAGTYDLPADFASSSVADMNWMNNIPGVLDGGMGMGDWISNVPGAEGVDYLGSLGAEGLGQGMDLADVASSGFDFGSFGGGSIPYLSIASGLSDGKWGWGDTGAAVGSFFGGPIGGMVGSVIGQPVGDLVEGIGGAVSDAVESVGDIFGGGGCFLTTACMRHYGNNFDDAGRELTALRDLRDNYAKTLPEGKKLVEEYYREAPFIVANINQRKDADKVWEKLYHEFITPAVEQVESGNPEAAYKTYIKMVNWTKEQAEV